MEYISRIKSCYKQVFQEAIAARNHEVGAVKASLQRYIERYGESITHGEGEFSAQALLRLAGWTGR